LFSLNSSETVEVAEVAQWLCVKVSLPVANFLKPEKRLQALADLALTSATLCSFSSELVRFETTHLGWKVVQE
jgi:ABC-type spermidine/putrescine transport system permease subunit I